MITLYEPVTIMADKNTTALIERLQYRKNIKDTEINMNKK